MSKALKPKLMKTATLKLKQALKNRETFIAQMARWDDKQLQKHLNLFRQQMELAYRQQNHEAFALLQEYEEQVINAGITKFDTGFSEA